MSARTVLRWGGRIAIGAVALVLIVAAVAYGLSEVRMGRTYAVADHSITPRTDSASLALGARLAKVRGCADCHGANLGGSVMAEDPALGRLVAPNLTMGGRGAQLDAQRGQREGRRL